MYKDSLCKKIVENYEDKFVELLSTKVGCQCECNLNIPWKKYLTWFAVEIPNSSLTTCMVLWVKITAKYGLEK